MFRVAGPSIWPLILALALTAVSVALIFKSYLLATLAILISVAALIGWHRGDEVEEDTAEAERFSRIHGIPVRPEGSQTAARWGVLLSIASVGIALVTLLFSYLYIWIESPGWPPASVEPPNLLAPVGAGTMVLAATFGAARSAQLMKRGRRSPFVLVSVVAVGIGAVCLQLASLAGAGFSWSDHAYGSLFFVVGWFYALMVLSASIMTTTNIFTVLRRQAADKCGPALENSTLFWLFVLGSWPFVFAALFLPAVF